MKITTDRLILNIICLIMDDIRNSSCQADTINISVTSIKYLVTCQFVYLIYISWNFKMYVLRYMWCWFCRLCTGIRCEHKFAINAALVKQFNAIKNKSCRRALGVTILKI